MKKAPLFRSVFPKTKEKSRSPKAIFTKDQQTPKSSAKHGPSLHHHTTNQHQKNHHQVNTTSSSNQHSASPYPSFYPNLPILPPNILDFCVANDEDFGQVEEHPRPVLHGSYDRGGDWAKSALSASHSRVDHRDYDMPQTSGVVAIPVSHPEDGQEAPNDHFFIRIYAGGRPITKLTSLSSVVAGIKPPNVHRTSMSGRSLCNDDGNAATTASYAKLGSFGSLLDCKSYSTRPSSSRITFAKEPTVSVIGVDTNCSTPFERMNAINEKVSDPTSDPAKNSTGGSASNPSSRATSLVSFGSSSAISQTHTQPQALSTPTPQATTPPQQTPSGPTYRAIVNATKGVTKMKFGGCGGGPGRQQTFTRSVITPHVKGSTPVITVGSTDAPDNQSVHPRRRQSSINAATLNSAGGSGILANTLEDTTIGASNIGSNAAATVAAIASSRLTMMVNKKPFSNTADLQALSNALTGVNKASVSKRDLFAAEAEEVAAIAMTDTPTVVENSVTKSTEITVAISKGKTLPIGGSTATTEVSSSNVPGTTLSSAGLNSVESGEEKVTEAVKKTSHRWDSAPSVHKGSAKKGAKVDSTKTVIACEPKSPNVVRSCTVKEKKDEPLEILVYRDEKARQIDTSDPGYILRYAEIDFSADQLFNPPAPKQTPRSTSSRPNSASPQNLRNSSTTPTQGLTESPTPTSRSFVRRPSNATVSPSSGSRAGSAGTSRSVGFVDGKRRSTCKKEEEEEEEEDGDVGRERLTMQEIQILQSIENLNKVLFGKLVKINGEKG
ncbi:hypothetical protein HDU67_004375 [Dinochytrium kinnereticum]|nr:hypothetical protein HDU67_004375 [Dinochytrium kinnereticum]